MLRCRFVDLNSIFDVKQGEHIQNHLQSTSVLTYNFDRLLFITDFFFNAVFQSSPDLQIYPIFIITVNYDQQMHTSQTN